MGTCCSTNEFKSEYDDPVAGYIPGQYVDDHDDPDPDNNEGIIDDKDDFIPQQMSSDHDYMFQSFAVASAQETGRRATYIDETADIFTRKDIPIVAGYGTIDNEESGECIILFWARHVDVNLFIPLVLCDLIVQYVDVVYRSRWSKKYSGPDVKLGIIDGGKATLSHNAIDQCIRAEHGCLRNKISVFYVTINGLNKLDMNNNFIGVVSEYATKFNGLKPNHDIFGICIEGDYIYKGTQKVRVHGNQHFSTIKNGQKVKCVVDLREKDNLIFKCVWELWGFRVGGQPIKAKTVVQLPNEDDDPKWKDVRWYPCIGGLLKNTTCILDFDETSHDTLNHI